MKKKKKKSIHTDTFKRYVTNAVTEIKETIGEGNIPISSDEAVEEARDWGSNGSRL
ncbi:MAG: hypothetical protein ACOYEI_05845 [Acetivibrionales bacterium]|nr:hypothetical protein [Clostridiaceae bacterium]